MAFKLTKAESNERATLVENLSKSKVEVEAAIAAYNDDMKRAWQTVQEMVEGYNEHVQAAAAFRDRIVEARQNEWDEKSEKWQEGDRGEAAQGWISEWENASLEELELDEPAEVEEPTLEEDETLGGLADEMDT